MTALKLAVLFVSTVAGVIAGTWLIRLLSGDVYRFPDGWIFGIGIGLAAVIGARLRARTEATR